MDTSSIPDLAQGGPMDPAMRERVQRVSGAAIFAVAKLDKLQAAPNIGSQGDWLERRFGDAGGSIKWLTVSAQPQNDSIKVHIAGECDGAWSATQLGLVLDGAHLMARQSLKDPSTRRQMSPQQFAMFEHIVQHAAITREGRTVHVRVELTTAVLDAVASPPGPR